MNHALQTTVSILIWWDSSSVLRPLCTEMVCFQKNNNVEKLNDGLTLKCNFLSIFANFKIVVKSVQVNFTKASWIFFWLNTLSYKCLLVSSGRSLNYETVKHKNKILSMQMHFPSLIPYKFQKQNELQCFYIVKLTLITFPLNLQDKFLVRTKSFLMITR